MSLLLTQNLPGAISILRGQIAAPRQPSGFRIDGESVVRWTGIEPAIGYQATDTDRSWASVVRAWWDLGATWGLCVSGEQGEQGEVGWNFVLPENLPTAINAVSVHLKGARLDPGLPFARLVGRLRALPFQAALAGHPGIGDSARMEPAVRAMAGRDFLLLVLAKAVLRPEIEIEIQRIAAEEQFVKDEYLARPGLEQDNHSAAARYLALLEEAGDRADIGLQEGAWQVRILLATANGADLLQAKSLIHSAFAADGGKPEPLRWQDAADPRLSTFLRTAELAALSRPPQQELPGFTVETRISKDGHLRECAATGIFATTAAKTAERTIAIGQILDDSANPSGWFELLVEKLCRHLLIAGMTGSGKSVSCEQIVLELWREYQIPSLIIEPGLKSGYRRLANSEIGKDLDIWAVGVPRTRRLPLNPMAAPAGVSLAEHTSALFAVISSAFELVPPMPEVLATAIENTYRRQGWDLTDWVPQDTAPGFADLINEIDRSTHALGYTSEIAQNIRTGLLLRLERLARGPLASEFNSREGLDVSALVKRPTLIELSALPDASSQALVMGLIGLQLRHHWRLAGQSDTLRHITVIEEAHRLLRAVPETAANSARNRAVEDLANMLAELRGFGAGLIIVDQTPSALVPAVIANTGTKLLHRLDHPDDRELAGRAAGLPADQVDLLGVLRPGDAILRSDRRPRPFRLRMPNPSVTYADKPVPDLPIMHEEGQRAGCAVCGQRRCRSATEGADASQLHRRIAALQAAFRASLSNAAEWADREMQNSGIVDPTSTDRLCFLIGLAEAARLSPSTIQRIREGFAP